MYSNEPMLSRMTIQGPMSPSGKRGTWKKETLQSFLQIILWWSHEVRIIYKETPWTPQSSSGLPHISLQSHPLPSSTPSGGTLPGFPGPLADFRITPVKGDFHSIVGLGGTLKLLISWIPHVAKDWTITIPPALHTLSLLQLWTSKSIRSSLISPRQEEIILWRRGNCSQPTQAKSVTLCMEGSFLYGIKEG